MLQGHSDIDVYIKKAKTNKENNKQMIFFTPLVKKQTKKQCAKFLKILKKILLNMLLY